MVERGCEVPCVSGSNPLPTTFGGIMAKRKRNAKRGNIKGLCYECSKPVNVSRQDHFTDPKGLCHSSCMRYSFNKLFPSLQKLEGYFDGCEDLLT